MSLLKWNVTTTAAVAAATLTALAAPASPAWAQTYKCTQPDGKTAFQDQPCHMSGGTGGSVNIKVTPPSSDAPPPRAPGAQQPLRQRSPYAGTTGTGTQTADAQQARQQADAYSRSVQCNSARSNLGALKAQRPVFQYDNKGERQYLDDSKRQAEMAAAQRGVAENCR